MLTEDIQCAIDEYTTRVMAAVETACEYILANGLEAGVMVEYYSDGVRVRVTNEVPFYRKQIQWKLNEKLPA